MPLILRGHREIRPFFEEAARRRPYALVRWHRTGRWLTDGERQAQVPFGSVSGRFLPDAKKVSGSACHGVRVKYHDGSLVD